jgi:type 1 glutamine amidotransferase
MRRFLFAIVIAVGFIGCSGLNSSTQNGQSTQLFKVLVFSKTAGFRHDSIPDGIALIRQLGAENHFGVDASEDATLFNDANLASYNVVLFLNTTGDILNSDQQAAFQHFIEKGKGFVGIHSASDTQHTWAWYGGLIGAYFQSHPAIQPATIKVEDRSNPSTIFLGSTWQRTDEWYNFATNPRGKVHILLTIDESTYSGGTMGADHPLAWCHFYDGGRSWYTENGHTKETYSEPLYQQHVLGGIEFAAGMTMANCQP